LFGDSHQPARIDCLSIRLGTLSRCGRCGQDEGDNLIRCESLANHDDRGRIIVGLISDTHGQVRPDLTSVFAGVDLIVHAGDVGGAAVLDALTRIAPVAAVAGNVDDPRDPRLPREHTLTVGELTLHVSHGDELGRPTPSGLLARYQADVLVYGHTHEALELRASDGRLVINPGAAGPRRFHLQPSVAILTIEGRQAAVAFVPLPA
jgi:hypothetical protein